MSIGDLRNFSINGLHSDEGETCSLCGIKYDELGILSWNYWNLLGRNGWLIGYSVFTKL